MRLAMPSSAKRRRPSLKAQIIWSIVPFVICIQTSPTYSNICKRSGKTLLIFKFSNATFSLSILCVSADLWWRIKGEENHQPSCLIFLSFEFLIVWALNFFMKRYEIELKLMLRFPNYYYIIHTKYGQFQTYLANLIAMLLIPFRDPFCFVQWNGIF